MEWALRIDALKKRVVYQLCYNHGILLHGTLAISHYQATGWTAMGFTKWEWVTKGNRIFIANMLAVPGEQQGST
ncbi:MAG: hypothetical protein CTY16_08190 [Methylobacter sp.]|nr:MAG: hypothetical protein CTY16_08190 [Methylobacter sp.]